MSIQLNQESVRFLSQQIRQGNVVVADRGDWHELNPGTEAVDEYLNNHSYQEYALWHLGIRPTDNPQTREAYAFPVGDFHQVYYAGLKAAHERAKQYGYADIEEAAQKLLALISSN